MVAGIVLQLSNGKNIQEAFLYGVASGRAATMNAGTELYHKKDADELYFQLESQYQRNMIIPS